MEKFELIAPCHFGMEAVLKREILDLGYEITKVEDGKVTFEADAQGIARNSRIRRWQSEGAASPGSFFLFCSSFLSLLVLYSSEPSARAAFIMIAHSIRFFCISHPISYASVMEPWKL